MMRDTTRHNYNLSDPGFTAVFDATFNQSNIDLHTNPELWLFLGVKFVQAAAGPGGGTYNDGTGTSFPSKPWPAADWITFKNTIISNSNTFWDKKYWIIPPKNTFNLCKFIANTPQHNNISSAVRYKKYNQNFTHDVAGNHLYSFNIFCRVCVYESVANPHITITAPYLNTGLHDDNSFINRASLHTSVFESGIIERRNLDNFDHPHHHHSQRQYLHEIGHALGQRHIGFSINYNQCNEVAVPAATAFHNACYNGGDERRARNVMGAGENLDYVNSLPWKRVMADLTTTNAADWGVTMHDRVYPRYIGKSAVIAGV